MRPVVRFYHEGKFTEEYVPPQYLTINEIGNFLVECCQRYPNDEITAEARVTSDLVIRANCAGYSIFKETAASRLAKLSAIQLDEVTSAALAELAAKLEEIAATLADQNARMNRQICLMTEAAKPNETYRALIAARLNPKKDELK